jgi:hypothetical protein
MVVVDGVGHWVDCTSLPGYVRVIQWRGDEGEIEFMQDHKRAFLPNVKFTDFAPYNYLVEKWEEAKAAAAAKTATDALARADGQAALELLHAPAAQD